MQGHLTPNVTLERELYAAAQPLAERKYYPPFSHATRKACWHEAMCDGQCSFVASSAFHCGVERDTQRQLWRFMARDAIVLEIGVREAP